jgi:POT family proton-dependent oligopeptide transporter
MWVKLSKIGKNPSIPLKFAFGIIQLAAGFLVTQVGMMFVNEAFQVPLLTLLFLYLLHTTGELFLSPIGLSMVTKLSPRNIAGTAMGAWFLSFAIANYVGGKIAALTGGHSDSGQALSVAEGLDKYLNVFTTIGLVLLGIAAIIILFNKPLQKLMHGVK